MGLDIVTNIMAQQASNDLSTNEANMQSALEKLSSGYQINNAADDASGLVISQHLQAQIGAFQQAQSNTQAGINVIQTASGALNTVSTILQRINTLAVEAQNGTATDNTAITAAQDEVNQSLSSIVDIAQTTVYGDNQLLVHGSASSVNYTFQVGYDSSNASQVAFSVSALTLANLGLVMNSVDFTAAGGISSVVSNLASGTYDISISADASAGASAMAINIANGSDVLGTAVVTDGGTAGEVATINLGTFGVVNLTLSGPLTSATALTATQTYANINSTTSLALGSADVIDVVQNAIATVSSMQGEFGAYQNELQHISDNETVMVQNLQSSNASIEDTNMASEMVNFTQDQVLVQAGVSMLAQANQIPQYVLKLLG
ncbi:MAG: flagellin [Acidimicrobiales bacterium]